MKLEPVPYPDEKVRIGIRAILNRMSSQPPDLLAGCLNVKLERLERIIAPMVEAGEVEYFAGVYRMKEGAK